LANNSANNYSNAQPHSKEPWNGVELYLRRRHASRKILGFLLLPYVLNRTSSENTTESQKGPGHEPRFAGDLPVKRCKFPDVASPRGLTQWSNQLLFPAASLDVTVA